LNFTKLFLLPDKLTIEEGKNLYINTIKNDIRFNHNINIDRLNIIDSYLDYYYYNIKIFNLPYFLFDTKKNYHIDSKLDINYIYQDPNYILNEISRNDEVEIDDINSINLYQDKEDITYKRVIDKINNKAINIALDTNHIKYKDSKLQIGLIDKLDECNIKKIYEHILIFHYKSNERRNDFISILSLYNKTFYKLEFEHNDTYLEFYKYYKRPSMYIPKDYLDYYYNKAFNSYISIIDKLKFETNSKILKKIKEGIMYKDYSLYNEYLDLGIYYYRLNKYLNKYEYKGITLKERIYYSYLTLYYNKDSGVFLANSFDLDLLDSNNINTKIKYLKISNSLGSLEAKALLFKHYSSYLYYDESKKNRYA